MEFAAPVGYVEPSRANAGKKKTEEVGFIAEAGLIAYPVVFSIIQLLIQLPSNQIPLYLQCHILRSAVPFQNKLMNYTFSVPSDRTIANANWSFLSNRVMIEINSGSDLFSKIAKSSFIIDQ